MVQQYLRYVLELQLTFRRIWIGLAMNTDSRFSAALGSCVIPFEVATGNHSSV